MVLRQRAGPLVVDQGRAEHPPVGVDLELVVRRVADAHRSRAGVPLEMIQARLDHLVAGVDPEHEVRVLAAELALRQQEVHVVLGLVLVAQLHQRQQRQCRVTQPRVAVVPVALAAELLGQRRRRRG